MAFHSTSVFVTVIARSLALLCILCKASAQSPVKRPKIYVHDLAQFRVNNNKQPYDLHEVYGLELELGPQLLASPYVTTNPEEADFFFVHAWFYYNVNPDGSWGLFTRGSELIKALNSSGPWWSRKQGRDHIFLNSHDHGLCDFQHQSYLQDIKDTIFMSHWGRLIPCPGHLGCGYNYNGWDPMCDPVISQHMREADPRMTPCYTPGKGLVVPPIVTENPDTTPYLNEALAKFATNRSTLLFFAGGNPGDDAGPRRVEEEPEWYAGFSLGVRQTVLRMYSHEPGFQLAPRFSGGDLYFQAMASSKFCLAPAGGGWGARQKTAITRGCVPVIIQDGNKVEWEDELPMHEFAVRIPFMYIHKLPEILKKHERLGRLAVYQKNLKCIWPLFWWQRPHGRGLEMLLCALKARTMNFKIQVDFDNCRINCGEGFVDFRAAPHSV